MAAHAEDALRGPGISEVVDLALAVSTAEAGSAECLFPRKDSQVFDLVATGTAAVCAVIADEGSIAKEEKVRIGV